MKNYNAKLKMAVNFHGHLGPYLVLGVLAGEYALKKLAAKKYFGLKVKVYGASKKPKSCLIDGLQLSTGATYGKGNIEKRPGKRVKMSFINLKNNKQMVLSLKDELSCRLSALKGHKDPEAFAKTLYKIAPCAKAIGQLFNF